MVDDMCSAPILTEIVWWMSPEYTMSQTPKIHLSHAVEVAQAKSGTAIEAVPWRKTSEVLGIKGWVWLDFASWSNDYSKHVWFLRRPSLCLG